MLSVVTMGSVLITPIGVEGYEKDAKLIIVPSTIMRGIILSGRNNICFRCIEIRLDLLHRWMPILTSFSCVTFFLLYAKASVLK
jgi:hypothetical protein